MNFQDELIRYLSQDLDVTFDAEPYNGFGWYWHKGRFGYTDGRGYATKHDAALGACERLGFERLVIHLGTGRIVFAGSEKACVAKLRMFKPRTADIAHLNGQAASYRKA